MTHFTRRNFINLIISGALAPQSYADACDEKLSLELGSYSRNRLYYRNFTRQFNENLRRALDQTRSNISNTIFAHVGDSTTRGTNVGLGDMQASWSYPSQLANLMRCRSFHAGSDNIFGGGSLIDSAFRSDRRVRATGDMRLAPGLTPTSLGGSLFTASNTGSLDFGFADDFDTIDLYYVSNVGLGSFGLKADKDFGVEYLSCSDAAGLRKKSFRLSSRSRNVSIYWRSGLVYFCGINVYNSDVKQICCLNLGWPGATSAQISRRTAPFNYANALSVVAPHLTFLSCGINDWTAGTPLPQYRAALQAVIDTTKMLGNVIVYSPLPSAEIRVPLATQEQYVGALSSLADVNSLPFVDIWSIFNRLNIAKSKLLYSDLRHGSVAGYAVIASLLASAIDIALAE